MTYGDLLQLLPNLANRSSSELNTSIDVVRRAVKYAYNYVLSRVQLDCFYGIADVEVPVGANLATTGLAYGSFVDSSAENHSFVNIQSVRSLDERSSLYEPLELITRGHKAYREWLRRPFHRYEYVADTTPGSLPFGYLANGKLYFGWWDEPTLPTSVLARIEGTISLPNFLDTAVLNDSQLAARDWLLTNAENYLVAKSLEFIWIYLKEDERAAFYAGLSEKEFTALCQLDSAIKDSSEGYSLD